MKIAIVTGVWQRPHIFELFAQGLREYMAAAPQHEWAVIVAGSEGPRSRALVQRHGFQYLEIANHPLATKMNATTLAAQKWGADYVLCLGSDDILHPNCHQIYGPAMQQGFDYVAVVDWYFFDTATRQSLYWAGYQEAYRKGHAAGPGRLISARLMNEWNWTPWEVRDSALLDNSMQKRLNATAGIRVHITSLLTNGCFALDIKSPVNMTPFRPWPNTCVMHDSFMKENFPYVWNSRQH